MVCGKTDLERVTMVVDIRGGELTRVNKFKHLDSTLKEGRGCEAEIQDRVKAAWAKWKEVVGVCDGRRPRKLKVNIYYQIIRPVIMYGNIGFEKKGRRVDNALEDSQGIKRRVVEERGDTQECWSFKDHRKDSRDYAAVVWMCNEESIKKAWKEPISGKY